MLLTDNDNWDYEPPTPVGESVPSAEVEEAYQNLRMIRSMMERSTKHSTLSGFSGILVGMLAVAGVAITQFLIAPSAVKGSAPYIAEIALTWTVILFLAVLTDTLVTKRRAASVGKHVFSKLGNQMASAAAPGFTVGLLLTLYFVSQGHIDNIWPYWMLCYGLAICSVGQFSVRPVSFLGWSFIAAGTLSLVLPHAFGIWMIAASFGGFNIIYGLYTGITRRDW